MADPVCPKCEVQGMEYIVSRDSEERARDQLAWFQVVHCDNCGHVYGVFAKHTITSKRRDTGVIFNR